MSSTHSRFPVVDAEGAVQGIVHAKDLLGVARDAYETTPVSSMHHELVAVPEAAGLDVVLAELRRHSTEMALVVDEYGAPAGVVTLEDIVEELVGEIEDEYDPTEVGEQVELEPGVWAIAATVRPDEIERVTGFDLPDGEYDTVAGLVLERLERLAEPGDVVTVDGILIEVVEVDRFAIQRVVLRRDPDAGDADADADVANSDAADRQPADRDDRERPDREPREGTTPARDDADRPDDAGEPRGSSAPRRGSRSIRGR
jgi:CBS domain containing-hemolysin-like protein